MSSLFNRKSAALLSQELVSAFFSIFCWIFCIFYIILHCRAISYNFLKFSTFFQYWIPFKWIRFRFFSTLKSIVFQTLLKGKNANSIFLMIFIRNCYTKAAIWYWIQFSDFLLLKLREKTAVNSIAKKAPNWTDESVFSAHIFVFGWVEFMETNWHNLIVASLDEQHTFFLSKLVNVWRVHDNQVQFFNIMTFTWKWNATWRCEKDVDSHIYKFEW